MAVKRVRITNLTGKGSKTIILDQDGEPITDVCAAEITIPMDGLVTAKLTHIIPAIDVIAFVEEDEEPGPDDGPFCPNPYGPCICSNGIGCANYVSEW